MSHTLGPWRVGDRSEYLADNWHPVIALHDGCEVSGRIIAYGIAGSLPVQESAEANARLIAAAPNMFAELAECPCPRPANAAPDNLTVRQCLDRNECGCSRGGAIAKADSADTET